MDIYIRPHKKTTIAKDRLIHLKDIAEISAPEHAQRQVENIIVFRVPEDRKSNYVISVIQIIRNISKEFPSATICNEGAECVVLQYLPKEWKENKLWTYTKVAVVGLTLFAGSCIAIMAYHEDASLPDTFVTLHRIFTGVETENPYWITIPYSIGVGIGITVFFNQFGTRKITDDPTPIQVEMNKYEDEINTCLVDANSESPRGGER